MKLSLPLPQVQRLRLLYSLFLLPVLLDALPGVAQSSVPFPSNAAFPAGVVRSQKPAPIDSRPLSSPDAGYPSSSPPAGFSSVSSSTASNSSGGYVLGSGDRVKIEVFNVPELSGDFDVSVDGVLNLPWVGPMPVQGLTVNDLRQQLQQRYSQFVNRPPVINLKLSIPRPIRVAVAGEVYRPGTYVIDFSGEPTRTRDVYRFPTLTQLIQKAGGITQVANVRNVEIRRLTNLSEPQVIDVDLWKLVQAGDIAQDITLRDGDTIMIPTASKVDLNESVRLGRVNFAPDKMNVQVVGEVVTPGSVSLPPNTALNQAILTAGGFKNGRARPTAVELIRLNPDGTVKRQTISVNFAAQPNEVANPLLQPNDVIVVKRSTAAGIADAIGALGPVFSPFSFLSNLINVLK